MTRDKLCFYSKSRDVPPGQGAKEFVADPSAYLELASVPQWRQELSNFSTSCRIPWHELTFRSIEHAFQYTKIALADDHRARLFALESGSELALGDGKAAQKARKLVKLDNAQIARWGAMSGRVMQQLAAIKLRECAIYRRVLKATGGAELWHIRNRQPAERWRWLELLRDEL